MDLGLLTLRCSMISRHGIRNRPGGLSGVYHGSIMGLSDPFLKIIDIPFLSHLFYKRMDNSEKPVGTKGSEKPVDGKAPGPVDGKVPGPVGPDPFEIKLKPRQEECFAREFQIFKHSFFALNESGTGEGKTYTTCKMIKAAEFPAAIILCPGMMCNDWTVMQKRYNIPIISIMSYGTLCSKRGSQPTHGFLKRTDYEDSTTTFEVLPAYLDLVKAGVLIVIDEAQYAKNNTHTARAVAAMARPISRNPGSSRIMLLSATPFDKIEQVTHLFKTLGLHNTSHGLYIQPIIDMAHRYDKDTTDAVLKESHTPKGIDVTNLCYQLYINVIRKFVCTAMISSNKSVRINFYAKLPNGIDADYNRAVLELHNAVASRRSCTSCATILNEIQRLKMHAVIRLTEEKLREPPRRTKVIIFASYLDPINFAAEKLAHWNPLVITGAVKNKERRHEMIQMFQTPSASCRLLIINSSIGSVGLSLDDTNGMWPRVSYVMPDYNIMRIHQTAGRTDRINTRSKSYVYVVYGKGEVREMSILNALSRKTDVLIDTQPDHVNGGIVYPGDYPEEHES